MVAPQSVSVVQGASVQKPVVVFAPASTGVGAGSITGQGASGAHGGAAGVGVAIGTSVQVKPFPQSAAVWHSWARALGANARRAVNVPNDKRVLLSDIDDLRARVGDPGPASSPAVLGQMPSSCQRVNTAIRRVRRPRKSVS
jgi:hypothetical protein